MLGIQFDKDGYKISWNSQNASGEYDEKAQCFVDQYDNYTLGITDKHGHYIKVNYLVNIYSKFSSRYEEFLIE